MILIGSKAIKYHYPDFPREPKDTDYIVKEVPSVRLKSTEYLKNEILDGYNKDILDPTLLLTLKASHLVYNINWEKHLFDCQFLLKKGNRIEGDMFYKLYEYWGGVHGKNTRSDLKMTKDKFFTNAINYDNNEHDETHKIINKHPIYLKVLKDGCDVELDESKFHSLEFNEKLEFVREEVYVMAWERFKDIDYRLAFSRMLKKFIISHAPIWSLTFIIENFIELHKPKINFIKIINENKIK